MNQPLICLWILAGATFLFGGVNAALEDPVHYLPPSVPKPAVKPGDREYPMYRPVHSLNDLNITRVRHVHKCLQDWCDDRQFIWELGGKIRCKSDHDTGENVVAWICNTGYFRKVCSSAILNEAAKHMIGTTSDYAVDTPSGHIYYNPVPSESFVIGWDTYCDGSPSCGHYRDPTIVCEDVLNNYRHRPTPKAVQYESITNGYGSVHHDGYQNEGEEKNEKSGSVYDGITEETEEQHGSRSVDPGRNGRYQDLETIKNITAKGQPVKIKGWPMRQEDDLKKMTGANPENEYHNPKHGKYTSGSP